MKMKNGTCQNAQIIPNTIAARSALSRACIDSNAYPIQPTSSPAAKIKKNRKTAGNVTSGVNAGGTCMPNKSIHTRESRKMRGDRRMITIYHRLFAIFLKSNILPSSSFRPLLPRLRNVRIEADAIGVTVKRAMYRAPISGLPTTFRYASALRM